MEKYLLTPELETIKSEKYKIYRKKNDDGFTYVYPEKLRDYKDNPENIDFISVLPGVGKTHWAIRKIVKGCLEKDYIYLFIAPTINLLDEVHKKLSIKFSNNNISEKYIKKIHGSDDSWGGLKVSNNFITALESAKKGSVFLITHALYISITDMPRKKEIFAIFDEAQSFGINTLELNPNEKDLETLKKHLRLEPIRHRTAPLKITGDFKSNEIEIYFKIHSKNKFIENYKKEGETSLSSKYLDFLKMTVHKKLDVYMIKKKAGKGYSFFSFSSPKHTFEGFGKIYLMGAFFEYSELWHVLKKQHNLIPRNSKLNSRIGAIRERFSQLKIIPILKDLNVDKQSDNYLSKNILSVGLIYKGNDVEQLKTDFTEAYEKFQKIVGNENRSKVLKLFRCFYLEESLPSNKKGEKFSEDTYKNIKKIMAPLQKKYAEKLIGLFDHLLNTATKNFRPKTDALAVVNKMYIGDKKSPKIKSKNFITSKVHGLNKYSHMNTMVFLSAIRPNTTLINFFHHFIERYSWQDNLLAANIVQALCRLHIRDNNSVENTYVYVPTYETAKLIQSMLSDYLDVNSSERLTPLDTESKIITLSSLISFERKTRKTKESLLLKNKVGKVIGKTTSREIFRMDKTYKELENKKNVIHKKITNYTGSKKSAEFKNLEKEKIKLLQEMKKRGEQVILERNN